MTSASAASSTPPCPGPSAPLGPNLQLVTPSKANQALQIRLGLLNAALAGHFQPCSELSLAIRLHVADFGTI